jgi:hypothetical protein
MTSQPRSHATRKMDGLGTERLPLLLLHQLNRIALAQRQPTSEWHERRCLLPGNKAGCERRGTLTSAAVTAD